MSRDDFYVNIIDFYAIVSWITSDSFHTNVEWKVRIRASALHAYYILDSYMYCLHVHGQELGT